jgi:hypothetical protein
LKEDDDDDDDDDDDEIHTSKLTSSSPSPKTRGRVSCKEYKPSLASV